MLQDDVPLESKRSVISGCWRSKTAISMEDNQRFVGQQQAVLVEGPSKAAEKKEPADPICR